MDKVNNNHVRTVLRSDGMMKDHGRRGTAKREMDDGSADKTKDVE